MPTLERPQWWLSPDAPVRCPVCGEDAVRNNDPEQPWRCTDPKCGEDEHDDE